MISLSGNALQGKENMDFTSALLRTLRIITSLGCNVKDFLKREKWVVAEIDLGNLINPTVKSHVKYGCYHLTLNEH